MSIAATAVRLLETSRAPASVCPIPRCATEMLLGAVLASIGLALLFSPHEMTFITIYGGYGPKVRLMWGFLLAVPGLFQCVSLCFNPRALHRLASLISLISGLAFTGTLLTAPDFPILAGPVMVATAGEIIVYTLLRGARWRA